MKTIWKVEKEGKEMYFAANLTIAVVRLGKEYNCKVEPMGSEDFIGAIAEKYGYKITDLKGIRKVLKAMN